MHEAVQKKQAQQWHQEVRGWQNELATWHTDLIFLSRMADIYGLKLHLPDERARLSDLNGRVRQFLEVVTALVHDDLRPHEEQVRKVAEDRLLLRDRELPYRHTEHANRMDGLRLTYRALRDALYATVEHLRQL